MVPLITWPVCEVSPLSDKGLKDADKLGLPLAGTIWRRIEDESV